MLEPTGERDGGGAGSKEGAAKQNMEFSYPLLSIPYASWKWTAPPSTQLLKLTARESL